jgi:hypothetical protein
MVPEHIVLLLSGLPATGKSEFGRHLAREHGFAHYDLECYPRGWPHPELKQTWDSDRKAFVVQLRQNHDRVVLDWGFPVGYLPWVEQLQDQNVRLIWFDGDVNRARERFVQRGGIEGSQFDKQIREIQQAGYPDALRCLVVPALSASGEFMDRHQIERFVFL